MSEGRILVVEDDADVANLLHFFFESQGYQVSVASTGPRALDLCSSENPHAVILDIQLPEMDGYQVCRRLRENLRTSHIPILFLTQRGERSDRIAGLELGADDYITKPFDINELKLRVQNAIKRARWENLTSPTTGLPSGKLIEEQLNMLMRRQNWAILYTGINHISEFKETYSFMAVDDVLRFMAMILDDSVEEYGTPNDFIGHVGADDFIVITDVEHAEPIRDYIMERFKNQVSKFYSSHDRERGYILLRNSSGGEIRVPLMTLAVGLVDTKAARFSDIREITEIAVAERRKAMEADVHSIVSTPAIEAVIDPGRERERLVQELRTLVARKNKQRELVRVYQEEPEFAQLLEETSKLAAGVSHDLQSSLGIIKNTVELMLDTISVNDPQRRDLEKVSADCEYCKMLLQNLLELSFETRSQPRLVSLKGLIQEAGALVESKTGFNMQLEMFWDSVQVYADADQIKQVFANLIRRAVVPASDRVQLSIKVEPSDIEDHVTITVSSSVFQIPSDQQSSAFDLSFMPDQRGYNVGLFVARKILARHNADITAVSRHKAATEFVLLLPLYRSEDRVHTLKELSVELDKVRAEVKALDEAMAALRQEKTHTLLSLSQVNKLVRDLAIELLSELRGIKRSVGLMLRNAGRREPSAQDLRRIVRSCQYCELLVRNLLEIGTAKGTETLQPVDINAALTDAVLLLESKILPEVKVDWDLDAAMPGVMGDGVQLRQVFMNLVINALDAMPEGGILTIHSMGSDDRIVVEVADTGYGIPDENLHRIFDLYFTTKREGYGIGLHIVKSVVEKLGGDVAVTSQVNKGSAFVIRLPTSRKPGKTYEDAGEKARTQFPVVPTPSGSIQILIVEDDSDWLKLLTHQLQSSHYTIQEASKAREAIGLLQNNEYALVLLDWRMPGVGGEGILEAAKEASPATPIVVLSAYRDVEQRSRALRLGAKAFLDKPLTKEDWDALKNKVLEYFEPGDT
jgi:signal transduction histidine kinase/DNA-binding response OmpR family regulator